MKLKITVEGKVYEVEVEVEEGQPGPSAPTPRANPRSAPTAARPVGPAAAPAPVGGPDVADDKAVKSPLMGVVQAVGCNVGQEVEVDQPLVVLEAMKMLTTITSPDKAKVKNIFVAVGDSVKQGQVLVEFE